jgi:hypothetical protein
VNTTISPEVQLPRRDHPAKWGGLPNRPAPAPAAGRSDRRAGVPSRPSLPGSR